MTKIIKFPKRSKAYSDKFLRNVKPDAIGDFIKQQNPQLTLKKRSQSKIKTLTIYPIPKSE